MEQECWIFRVAWNIFIIASFVDHGDWNLGGGGGETKIVLKNYMYVK